MNVVALVSSEYNVGHLWAISCVQNMVFNIFTHIMPLCGFHWHPGIVFDFMFMLPMLFINSMQDHVLYRNFL